MTSRTFQDEINASGSTRVNRITTDDQGRLRRPDVPSTPNKTDTQGRLVPGGTNKPKYTNPFQLAYEKGLQGPRLKVLSAPYLYTDVNGHRVYNVTVRTPWGTTITRRQALRGLAVIDPGPMGIPEPGLGSGSADQLQRVQQNWLQWVVEMSTPGSISGNAPLTATTAIGYKNMIKNWKGSAADLNKHMEFIAKNSFAAPVNFDPITDGGFGDEGFPTSVGGGGGGGGGGLGPQYRAPDERVIEDFVKGSLISLVGQIPSDGMVSDLVKVYMKDDRRNFSSLSAEIDPSQSVLEAIRNTTQYKTIHKNRPDTEDERSWISSRRSAAAQGGLTTGLQEDFAITQATVAGDLPDVQDAAAVTQLQTSGSTRGTVLESKIRNVAQGMFGGVVI